MTLFRRLLRPVRPTATTAIGDTLIQMQRIVKTYRTPAGDFHALKGIDAAFKRGEFVAVVGKSGSGKSTLVNMITGIDRPTAGEVTINGTRVDKLGESAMARWRGVNLGIVFQFYQLLPMLSLLENAMLPMDLVGQLPLEQREARAMELLATVGLADIAHKLPSAASGGQQQAAAIARALANDPPVIVADEPTGNLDSRSAETVFHLFGALADAGKTIIMVTHDRALAERAGRKVLLCDGEIVSPAVATALPFLTHQQMLWATQHATSEIYQQGATILQHGEPSESLYMIEEGDVEIILPERVGETSLGWLSAGDYFGELELVTSSPAQASVRASRQPVRLLRLAGDVLQRLMGEALSLRQELADTASQRVQRGGRHAQPTLA